MSYTFSCCKKKDKLNCPSEYEIRANFTIQQDLIYSENGITKYFDLNNDTIYVIRFNPPNGNSGNQNIRLRFKTANADKTCEWQFGTDPTIRKGYEVKVDFQNVFGTLTATCMKQFTNSKECFPNLTGYDTVKKNFHFVLKNEASYYGTYLGYNEDSPNDTFRIKFDYERDSFSQYYFLGGFKLTNFPNKLIYPERELFIRYYEFFINNAGNQTNGVALKAHGFTQNNGENIIIDYVQSNVDPMDKRKFIERNRRFIGYKIK